MTDALNRTASKTDSELLDPAEIENNVLLIRQAATVQLERVQSYVDGATLAVEQVQDIRFRLLEKQLDATASQNFFSAVMTLCLESTIAGTVLVAVTSKIVRPMLRTTTAFQLLPAGRTRADVARYIQGLRRTGEIKSLAEARRRQRLFEAQGLKLGVSRLRRYAAALGRGSPGPTTDLIAVAKAAWAAAEGESGDIDSPPLVLDDTDTAGVGILAGAQEYASNHRLAIALTHAGLENFVRTAQMTKADMKALVEEIQWESLDEDLKAVRDHYKLMFEAVIWVKLYGFDTSRLSTLTGGRGQLPGIEKDLFEYWCRRFAQSIEEWAKQRPRGEADFGTATGIDPISKSAFLRAPEAKRASYIRQYFRAVGKTVPEDPNSFRSSRT